ncbi:MAG TPA: serine protease [Bacteroidetes bacterium]|nr:serine protease [Bacteroidota bacterium]
MPSWNELVEEFERQPAEFLRRRLQDSLRAIGDRRGGRNVIFYASAFLQKPDIPQHMIQITHEDVNGFMSCLYGMNWKRGLTLILHTPGGVTNAAESIVGYLYEKFRDIEVVVPTFAMSAGTMISLAADRVIMGRQSQLGPIDPQIPMGGRFVSAQAVVEQFRQARKEILRDTRLAHVWYPILQSIGPALLQEAQNAIGYSERMVANWLARRMFSRRQDAHAVAKDVAKFFRDASVHLSHGRRIDREEAKRQGLVVEDLEDDQDLQEAVLTAYHLMTIAFEKTPATKVIESNHDRRWIKNWHPVRIQSPRGN